jgi:hypothetical protein
LTDQGAERHEVADVPAPSVGAALALAVELEAHRELAARAIENAALAPRDVLDAEAGFSPEIDARATTDAAAFNILREVVKYVTPTSPINF